MPKEEPTEEDGGPAIVSNAVVDVVVAALLFIMGAVMMVESRRLGAGWTSDGPGAGYFPFFIGAILCISSAGILYGATLGKSRDSKPFIDRLQLKRVLSVLLPATVYVLFVNFLGLYVASALYIALFMIVLGKYSKLKSVLVGLTVNVLFFMMFEVWFKVPLFKGSLDPLAFLGY